MKQKKISLISKLLRKRGKNSFIVSIVKNGKVMDVGCGNNSPYLVKTLRPDVYYLGLDIDTYKQNSDYEKYADEYIIIEPEYFHKKIEEYSNEFDSIISAHNLEHCNDYISVTLAMIKALKKGGTIYISFPCEESANFPSRKGTLNFFDDETHKNLIKYSIFISLLKENDMDIIFSAKRYRPYIPFIIGLFCEPICRLLDKQAPASGTWSLFGFETIIIARKKNI